MSADARYGRLDARERRNLRELEKRLSGAAVTPQAVGGTLPEAMLTDNTDQQKLSKSIMSVTEEAIALSVETNPQALSTALFPIIGSAIRKALNKLLAETMARMNTGLEKTFSLRRLAWRFQAWRRGVPFMEIVLQNTLDFQVEHVFLIHRRTGILLHDCSRPDTLLADKDMVASMLTAVQTYIRDSLKLRRQSDSMHTMTVGDYSFVVEDGPQAIIALIVRGTLDPSLREVAQDALETIHLRMGRALTNFKGDTSLFSGAEQYLKPCLMSRNKNDGKKIPIYSIILLTVIFGLSGFFAVRGFLEKRERDLFIRQLRTTPGLVVTGVSKIKGETLVDILRDPHREDLFLARDQSREDLSPDEPLQGDQPWTDILQGELPRGLRLRSRDFLSLEPVFVLRRLKLILQPPPSVELYYDEGILQVQGPASEDWIQNRLPLAYAAGGIKKVLYDPEVRERHMPESLLLLAEELSAQLLFFGADAVEPLPDQEDTLERLGVLLQHLRTEARQWGLNLRIDLLGHAAGAVQDEGSRRISQERAEKAAALLIARKGTPGEILFPQGLGVDAPVAPETSPEGKAKNRSVSFRAVFH